MLDTGTTTFMIVATVLVMLMTPGLAFFYGGLVSKKNVSSIMFQSFVSIGITSILWWAFGYSICFSGGEGAVIGDFDKAFLSGVTIDSLYNDTFPEIIFIIYQLMFAIITPALLSGAFANRVTFKAYILFLVFWQIFVYYPFVHMVWGGGLLSQWGVLDFAGGIPVHAIAGAGALASVFYVGARRNTNEKPSSLPIAVLGASILWFGWYGFNAGSELAMDKITGLALFNTHMSASVAGFTWMIIEWKFSTNKKPTLIGFLTGAIAGLVIITPAAGLVSANIALLFGLVGAIVSYFAIALKNRLGWDDTLDVWGIHSVGGIFGMILLGVFASTMANANGADGLVNGGGLFLVKETVAVLGSSVYAFVITYIIFIIVNKITPVRVSESDEEVGLDQALHGEHFGDNI